MKSEKEIMDEISNHYYQAILKKTIEAVAHGDDTFCYEDFYVFPELFDALETYIMKNHQEHFLFEDAKKNLLTLIGYLRFEYKYPTEEERVKAFHWCNKLIGFINESTSENGVVYYCSEIAKRFQYQGYLTLDTFNEWLEFVYSSITDDIVLLESIDETADFYNGYYEEFLYNPYISNNMSLLLNQFPNTFLIEDLEKWNAVLVGQHALARHDNIHELEVQDSNGKHHYHIDQEACQTLVRCINVDSVTWIVNQITNVIDSSMSSVDGDIDIENQILSTDEKNNQKQKVR